MELANNVYTIILALAHWGSPSPFSNRVPIILHPLPHMARMYTVLSGRLLKLCIYLTGNCSKNGSLGISENEKILNLYCRRMCHKRAKWSVSIIELLQLLSRTEGDAHFSLSQGWKAIVFVSKMELRFFATGRLALWQRSCSKLGRWEKGAQRYHLKEVPEPRMSLSQEFIACRFLLIMQWDLLAASVNDAVTPVCKSWGNNPQNIRKLLHLGPRIVKMQRPLRNYWFWCWDKRKVLCLEQSFAPKGTYFQLLMKHDHTWGSETNFTAMAAA